MEKIIIKNLSLEMEENLILKDINMSCSSGESMVIIGESGSGKTMLSKLMVGLIPPNANLSGEVLYDSHDVTKLNEAVLREFRGSKIAYMTQNPMAMFNHFQRVRDHFIETLQSHAKISKKNCLNKALDSLKRVRLGHPERILNAYPFELSGGMLQRIMLAIVLCLNPETIILDEPTSALDAYNRDNVIKILKDLSNQGKTLITVTHDYDLAREIGNKIIVIHKGEIVEAGTISEILDTPQHPYTRDLVLGNPYERLVGKNA